MIEVEIHGRFGNHLFQYAFALAMSKELNTTFKLVHTHRLEMDKIFNLTSYRKSLIHKNEHVSIRIEKLSDRFLKRKKVIEVDNDKNFIPEDNVRYRGFYQCQKYFAKYDKEVRQEFRFKPKFIQKFEENFGKLYRDNRIIAVHIRRGDYLEVDLPELGSKGVQLPFNYYEKYLNELLDESKMVVFLSDDIEAVKNHFGESDQFIFSGSDYITDFMALMKADELIISNSSFSWWAAYLNSKEGKKVIAPKYHLGFKVKNEIPRGIMYEGFDWFEVPNP